MAQIANDPKMAGKPEKVIEGAVVGRLNKELKEVCLLEQVYVKAEDGKQTVAQYIAQVAKENSANLSVKRFVRFETGEGLEKKEENFAAEVAAQMNENPCRWCVNAICRGFNIWSFKSCNGYCL